MTEKRLVAILGSMFFFAIAIVLMLFLHAPKKLNHQYNSFLRKFTSRPVYLSGYLDVGYNSYYIAGHTSNELYFGNRSGVRHLLISNTNLTSTQHVELKIEGAERLKFRSITVKVDSPYFYFVDGSIPAIFRGRLGNWTANRYTQNRAYFVDLIPISNTSFAVTTTSSQTREYTLGKEMNISPFFKLASNLLEKQIDGVFCVDGMMHYSRDLNRLVYVYYYRNQFICADSNLNLVYRGNTVDTISQAKIKITNIKSERSVTTAAPPLIVNRKSCVAGSRLFINSNLLSNNEDIDIFENSHVIDVYDLEEGQYVLSFYLPRFKGKELRQFRVFNDVLIALYDHWVVKFQLDKEFVF